MKSFRCLGGAGGGLLLLVFFFLLRTMSQADNPRVDSKAILVVHGGAGTIARDKLTPERKRQYEQGLAQALRQGYQVLQKGGTSVEAVEAAIRVLEDNPLFNAGRGAVFTNQGVHRLDASIMEGRDRKAGAAAGVMIVKNPITLARTVMDSSEHVLLVDRGAELFAIKHKLDIVEPAYFDTPERWQQLQRALEADKQPPQDASIPKATGSYFGTVGAVAVDRHGNLAAGTSTGGMNNVKMGRVGDSPLIGAGTYADNQACGVSGTGHGEIFIRFAVAHDIAARMKYRKMTVQEAAATVLAELPAEEGGVGGVIALDAHGNFAMPYNTGGMYRGYVTEDGSIFVGIHEQIYSLDQKNKEN